MRILKWVIIDAREYARLLATESEYVRITDRDNKGRFVRREGEAKRR